MNSLNDCDLDLELNDETIASKKESVLSKMREKDLLRYGSLISEKDVEYIMDVKESKTTPDMWQFTKLQVREIVKGEGFYITSRGRQNDLYILLPHEMPIYNDKKNKASYRNLRQRSRGLNMIDQSILSEEHQKKLKFEIFRNARFEIEMSENLKQRCRY